MTTIPGWEDAGDLSGGGVFHDPTHGRIDRDIQQAVEDMHPKSLGQRVAIENTLQRRRDDGLVVLGVVPRGRARITPVSFYTYWRGRLRLYWGWCPACASSPPREGCEICDGAYDYGPGLPAGRRQLWRARWDSRR